MPSERARQSNLGAWAVRVMEAVARALRQSRVRRARRQLSKRAA